MMDTYEIADIEIYLLDEGLDENQISEFMSSHDITVLDSDEAWEIIESHIFRDDYDDDL